MALTWSRQNSLLKSTIVNPRYCSPRPIDLSTPSAIACRTGLVSGFVRSIVLPKRATSARTLSRSSRVSGTTLRCAVLGLVFLGTPASTTAVIRQDPSGAGEPARDGEAPQEYYRPEPCQLPGGCPRNPSKIGTGSWTLTARELFRRIRVRARSVCEGRAASLTLRARTLAA